MTALLEVRNLTKTFPGLRALDDVSITVGAGEIVALLGQNGSGKSTLVKILAGVYEPDPGASVILADGGGDAAELHFIHQDLGLVQTMSTVENLDLAGQLGAKSLAPFAKRREREHAQSQVAKFGGSFDVTRPIAELSAAERTIVAMVRALDGWTHDANVLVLDEPTASLHGDEVAKLFRAVRRVAERGAGVIFISHRLDEVIDVADRVVVLRDGHLVADVERGSYDHDDLVTLVAGAMVDVNTRRAKSEHTDPALVVKGLSGGTVTHLDVALMSGEIVGIAGVLGSGREEVASLLFGSTPSTCQQFDVAGQPHSRPTPRSCIGAGIAYVPGDRHRFGAVMTFTARENLTLPNLRPLRRLLWSLSTRIERREASTWVDRVGLRPAQPERRLDMFSGGNQQKVVLAKWLRNRPGVLLMDEPTQGVDIGAKAQIFDLVAEAAVAGTAVLICSSDAKELAQVCDRVLVMSDGLCVAELSGADLTEAGLIRAGLKRPAPSIQVDRHEKEVDSHV